MRVDGTLAALPIAEEFASIMVSADMSTRTHLWIRLAALAVIAAAAYLPRGTSATAASPNVHPAQTTVSVTASAAAPIAEVATR